MPLFDLSPEARPRGKLLALGPGSLVDAELPALLLRTGLAGKSVLHLAQDLLDRFGGVADLLKAELADRVRIKGLGLAKRAEIAAAALGDHLIVGAGEPYSFAKGGLL